MLSKVKKANHPDLVDFEYMKKWEASTIPFEFRKKEKHEKP